MPCCIFSKLAGCMHAGICILQKKICERQRKANEFVIDICGAILWCYSGQAGKHELRAGARTLIGGYIFIYSGSAD